MALVVKKPPAGASRCKRHRFDPWLGRSLGGGQGNPLQYSCLENRTDRGTWWAAVHGVAQRWTQLKQLSTSIPLLLVWEIWVTMVTKISCNRGLYQVGNDNPVCETAKETQMYRTVFWTLWEKARVGWSERIALNMDISICETDHQSRFNAWDRVLRAGALGWPRGMEWERGSEWGTHVHPWLIHVSVWQKPLQYCKVISLQLK